MLLTYLLLLAAAQESRWVSLGPDTTFAAVDIDRRSIRRSGERVTMWERRTFISRASMLREVEVDCGRRTLTVLAITWIEANGANRRTQIPAFERTPDSIDPESTDERVFAAVCG